VRACVRACAENRALAEFVADRICRVTFFFLLLPAGVGSGVQWVRSGRKKVTRSQLCARALLMICVNLISILVLRRACI
jgi:hypothetical protein